MIGTGIHKFAKDLWSINRSITGAGVRETLKQIKGHIPDLKVKAIPSETKVFDWTVPKEWNVNDAFILSPDGKKICDYKKNNLHLIQYSYPLKKTLNLSNLKKYLFSIPGMPRAIPYVTSYYKKDMVSAYQIMKKEN